MSCIFNAQKDIFSYLCKGKSSAAAENVFSYKYSWLKILELFFSKERYAMYKFYAVKNLHATFLHKRGCLWYIQYFVGNLKAFWLHLNK